MNRLCTCVVDAETAGDDAWQARPGRMSRGAHGSFRRRAASATSSSTYPRLDLVVVRFGPDPTAPSTSRLFTDQRFEKHDAILAPSSRPW